jgi:uncharacterized protein YbjT (DUF2867 family)
VARLLREGLPVRCLVNPHRVGQAEWADADGATPDLVVGDPLDPEAVFRAVTGVHTIIHLENAFWWGGRDQLERVEVLGTQILVEAARAARVGRIITLSHLGATPSSAYLLHRTKGRVEEIIRNSGLAYTIIRTGIVFGQDDAFINHIAMTLASNPLVYLMVGQGEVVLHPIHVDDLVQTLVQALESITVVDATIEFGGPEYTSMRDLVRTVMRVTGQRRLVIGVAPYLMRFIVRMYGFVVVRAMITPQWMDLLATNRTATIGNCYLYFGFNPRRIEDTLVTYMPGRPYLRLLIRESFRRRPRRR